MADERQRLIQAFVDSGRPVKDLVVAWTGLYPFWRGYSNYGYFFTLRRCVVLREGQLEVWTTWSGLPSKSLAEAPIVASGYARLGRKYDRFDVGDFTVWTAADDRVRIDEWLARGAVRGRCRVTPRDLQMPRQRLARPHRQWIGDVPG